MTKSLSRFFTFALLDAYPAMATGLMEFLVGELTASAFHLGEDVAISSAGEAIILSHCQKLLDLETITFPSKSYES
jgi:hypothetical protein